MDSNEARKLALAGWFSSLPLVIVAAFLAAPLLPRPAQATEAAAVAPQAAVSAVEREPPASPAPAAPEAPEPLAPPPSPPPSRLARLFALTSPQSGAVYGAEILLAGVVQDDAVRVSRVTYRILAAASGARLREGPVEVGKDGRFASALSTAGLSGDLILTVEASARDGWQYAAELRLRDDAGPARVEIETPRAAPELRLEPPAAAAAAQPAAPARPPAPRPVEPAVEARKEEPVAAAEPRAAEPPRAAPPPGPLPAVKAAPPAALPQPSAAVTVGPPHLEIVRPATGTFYQAEIRVEGRVSDSQGVHTVNEIQRLSYFVREHPEIGGEIFYGFADGSFRIAIPMAKIKGTVTIELRAARKHGPEASTALTLYDGTVRPALRVDSPADGSLFGARILLAGSTWDPSPEQGQPRGVRSLSYELRSADNLAAAAAASGSAPLDAQGGFRIVLDAGALAGRHELVLTAQGVNGSVLTRKLAIERGESAIPSFAAEAGDGSATLRWDPLPLAGACRLVYTADGTAPSDTNGLSVAASASPLTVSGLRNGVLYRFALRAPVEGFDTPEWSRVAEVLPVSSSTLTPVVTGEYRQIRVRWQAIPGAREYEVFRSASREGPFLSATRTSSTEFLDRRVRYGEHYYYRVAPAIAGSRKSDAGHGELASIPDDRLVSVSAVAVSGALAVAPLGDYAVVLDAGSLTVVDIFDLAEPTVVGRLPLESPTGLLVHDAWAFVVERGRGIKVIDLSNPLAPRVAAASYLPDALTLASFAAGGRTLFVYVAAADEGIVVLDARDPLHPVRIEPALPGRFVSASVAATETGPLLCASGPQGLALYGLGDPAAPRRLSSTPLDAARFATVSRRADGRLIAYAATGDSLALIDVSDPAAPRRITTVAVDDPRQAAVSCEPDGRVFAYIADGAGGVKVLDVSDPATPVLFGHIAIDADFIALRDDLSGRHYALTAGPAGLSIVDVFTQGRSIEVASASTGGGAVAVAVGSIGGPAAPALVVVVADGKEGVKLFAADDPGRLSEKSLLASIDTENAVDARLDADPPRIFVADRARGLRVIGIQGEPGRLRLRHLIGLDTGGDALSLDLQRRDGLLFAYVADPTRGVSIFDVTDESSARRLAVVPLPGALDVSVRGALAYVATGLSGLQIVDVADPAAPRLRSRLGELHARTVSVGDLPSGSLVAAVTGSTGLTTVDVSDPDSPRPLSLYRSSYAEDAVVTEGLAYLAEGIRGLSVIDVSKPEAPCRVSSSETEYAIAVDVRGGHAFVADHRGLRVVRIVVPDWLTRR